VKSGLAPEGRSKVLSVTCCGHLDLREGKWDEDGESSIIGRLTISAVYLMSLESKSRRVTWWEMRDAYNIEAQKG
jgi:hypothetical protein